MLTIGIPIFTDVEELDFIGPFEVLNSVNKIKPDSLKTILIAETLDPITCYNGLKVIPDTTLTDISSSSQADKVAKFMLKKIISKNLSTANLEIPSSSPQSAPEPFSSPKPAS